MKLKQTGILIVLFVVIAILSSCSKASEPVSDDKSVESQKELSAPLGTQAEALSEKPTPPAQEVPYEATVTGQKIEGQIVIDTIKSTYHCRTANDCSSTKYKNIPKTVDNCTCQTPCTPYVVSVRERNLRDNANKRLCGPKSWFGPDCPAPNCNFEEFDGFKCQDGFCVGLAEGKR